MPSLPALASHELAGGRQIGDVPTHVLGDFPTGCNASLGVPCAICAPYTAQRDQSCDAEADWKQCAWLNGDATSPRAVDVTFMLILLAAFSVGDAVWESQVIHRLTASQATRSAT